VSRDVLIVACAVSAGVHAALVPDHLAFVVVAVVLAGLAAALARGRGSENLVLDAAAVLLGGLIAAYVLAVTTGVPLLHPEPERVDGLGLVTKGIEAAGLLAALNLKGLFT
jgi:hypothetical protein